jgi:hypothetical protein
MIRFLQCRDAHPVVAPNRLHHEAQHTGQNRSGSRQAQSDRRDEYCTERNQIHVSLPKLAEAASIGPGSWLRLVDENNFIAGRSCCKNTARRVVGDLATVVSWQSHGAIELSSLR